MHLYCSRCNEKFDSLIIDKNIALKEITDRLVKHIALRHTEILQVLNQAIVKVSMAAGGFLTLTELATIPDEEQFIKDKLSECQDVMMAAIGYVVSETPGEGDVKADSN